MSIFPGASDQLFYLAPKVTPLAVRNFSLAGGMLYINTTAGTTDGVGFYYGVGTYGTSKAAVTFGLGWGFYGSDIADKPVVMLGGELRVSNSVKLISENWIPPNSDLALVSFGIRFFGENLAADLGFIRITGTRTEGFPFIPWLQFWRQMSWRRNRTGGTGSGVIDSTQLASQRQGRRKHDQRNIQEERG